MQHFRFLSQLFNCPSDIVTSAKALLVNYNINLHGLGAVVETTPVKQKDSTKIKVSCFSCSRSGHLQRDCNIICYRCGFKGHTQPTRRAETHSRNEPVGLAVLDRAAPQPTSRDSKVSYRFKGIFSTYRYWLQLNFNITEFCKRQIQRKNVIFIWKE